MLPDSTDGPGRGDTAVPMAWLCAEYTADELLRVGSLVEPGSLEYRAGRQALALTIHLCDGAGSGDTLSAARLDEWLSRTSYDHPWPDWVRARLAERSEMGVPPAEGWGRAARPSADTDADLALARETWRQLEATQLLAADLRGLSAPGFGPLGLDEVDESAQIWVPAWQLGLPLGHLALHLY
ncbi:hypothetical protein [Streptomyces tritici]|uniref:hypothetical protein n=1 Tax=Streptomyces tritici TaxID=2054410 RepID=UPI003AEFF4D5